MSQELPGVQLTQIAVAPNAILQDAEMFATFVGPLHRDVKSKVARANASFPVGDIVVQYPSVDPGMIIDLDSVKITVIDGVIQWLKPAAGALAFTAGTDLYVDNVSDFIASGVLPGDVVTPDGALNGAYTVKEVVDAHTLRFTIKVFKTVLDAGGYTITRKVPSWLLASNLYDATQTEVTVSSVANGSKLFSSGQLNISYTALRKDKSGILIKYTSLDEVMVDMDITPDNKLGYYLAKSVIPANGNSTAFLVYILEEDTDAAYMAALSDLIGHDEIYMLVPLTHNNDVVNAYASHVKAVSDPEESAFRVLFTTTEQTLTSTLGSGTVTGTPMP